MALKLPQDGGCWYCHTDDPPLTFCFEFDTYIHTQCIVNRGKQNKVENIYDPEWEIIAKEML